MKQHASWSIKQSNLPRKRQSHHKLRHRQIAKSTRSHRYGTHAHFSTTTTHEVSSTPQKTSQERQKGENFKHTQLYHVANRAVLPILDKKPPPSAGVCLFLSHVLPDSNATAAGLRTFGLIRSLAYLGFQPVIGTIGRITPSHKALLDTYTEMHVPVVAIESNDRSVNFDTFIQDISSGSFFPSQYNHHIASELHNEDTNTIDSKQNAQQQSQQSTTMNEWNSLSNHSKTYPSMSVVIYDQFSMEETLSERIRSQVSVLHITDTQDLHFLRHRRAEVSDALLQLNNEISSLSLSEQSVPEPMTSRLHDLLAQRDALWKSDDPKAILSQCSPTHPLIHRELSSYYRSDLILTVSQSEERLLKTMGLHNDQVFYLPITYHTLPVPNHYHQRRREQQQQQQQQQQQSQLQDKQGTTTPISTTTSSTTSPSHNFHRSFHQRDNVVFIGTMHHSPNVDCVERLYSEYAPLLEKHAADVFHRVEKAMMSTNSRFSHQDKLTYYHAEPIVKQTKQVIDECIHHVERYRQQFDKTLPMTPALATTIVSLLDQITSIISQLNIILPKYSQIQSDLSISASHDNVKFDADFFNTKICSLRSSFEPSLHKDGSNGNDEIIPTKIQQNKPTSTTKTTSRQLDPQTLTTYSSTIASLHQQLAPIVESFEQLESSDRASTDLSATITPKTPRQALMQLAVRLRPKIHIYGSAITKEQSKKVILPTPQDIALYNQIAALQHAINAGHTTIPADIQPLNVSNSQHSPEQQQQQQQQQQQKSATANLDNNPNRQKSFGSFLIRGFAKEAIPTLSRYRVLFAPLSYGAGVKGKVLDAWMGGTPAVGTDILSEGMNPEPITPVAIDQLSPQSHLYQQAQNKSNRNQNHHQHRHKHDNNNNTNNNNAPLQIYHNTVDVSKLSPDEFIQHAEKLTHSIISCCQKDPWHRTKCNILRQDLGYENIHKLHSDTWPGFIHNDAVTLTQATLLLTHCQCEWDYQHRKILPRLQKTAHDGTLVKSLLAMLENVGFIAVQSHPKERNDTNVHTTTANTSTTTTKTSTSTTTAPKSSYQVQSLHTTGTPRLPNYKLLAPSLESFKSKHHYNFIRSIFQHKPDNHGQLMTKMIQLKQQLQQVQLELKTFTGASTAAAAAAAVTATAADAVTTAQSSTMSTDTVTVTDSLPQQQTTEHMQGTKL